MDFLKKSRVYLVQHTKREATKELRKDKRIDIIRIRPNFMVIKTKPLKTDNSFYPKLALRPTGTYIITIKHSVDYNHLEIKIIRREGGVTNIHSDNRHHMHIDISNVYGKVCFGSANSEMIKIRENNDWYWAGIMCLNLLEDFTDHNTSTIRAIEHLVMAQITYAKNKKFTKLIMKKTTNTIKEDKKLMNEYQEEYKSFFIKMEV